MTALMHRRSFELQLLKSMFGEVRETTLRALTMSSAEADALAATCPIQLLDQRRTSAAQYQQVVGSAVRHQSCAFLPAAFEGSIQYSFVLPLWPHLFWTIYETRAKSTWNVGFQNQYQAPTESLSPADFRPGLVTFPLVRQAARKHTIYDGWDERVTYRFELEDGSYEGEFVWGLLQRWQSLPSSGQ